MISTRNLFTLAICAVALTSGSAVVNAETSDTINQDNGNAPRRLRQETFGGWGVGGGGNGWGTGGRGGAGVVSAAQGIADGVVSAGQGVVGNVLSVYKDVADGALSAGQGIADGVVSAGQGVVGNVLSVYKDVADGALSAGQSVAEGVSALVSGVSGGWAGVNGAGPNASAVKLPSAAPAAGATAPANPSVSGAAATPVVPASPPAAATAAGGGGAPVPGNDATQN